jgi:hypothetical protein
MPSILVDTSADGTTLIAAPSDPEQRIWVQGIDVSSTAAVTVTIVDGASTVIWKTLALAGVGGGHIVLPYSWQRGLAAGKGQSLKIGLSGSVAVAGSLDYSIR